MAAAREVQDALDRLGLRAREIALLSASRGTKRGRSTYRADLEDGRTIKARCLESAEEARRLFELRVDQADDFAHPIARYSRVLVEPWIEGTMLDAREAEARAEQAGALLGRLHASPLADGQTRIATRSWCDFARGELDRLGAARRLTAQEVAKLGERLSRTDPGSGRAALVHVDFCPQNMLIDREGRLRVVDNEWFRIDAAAWDVARTFVQWPMSKPVREDFLRGYRATAPEEPGSLAFWEVVVALWTLRIRREDAPERLDEPLALLRTRGRA